MKFILGKKMGMTQIWKDNKVIGVTPVKAGPCTITQIKNTEKDGYNALQLAYGVRKEKNIKKPQIGHFKKADVKPTHVREFRLKDTLDVNIGDTISANIFNENDTITVTGRSKGKGFQGVVKRHGFHGFRATHGNKDQQRMPGSIGATGPAHVFKGIKMGGRTGDSKITTSNLEVVSVDEENDIIFVKGALPGALNSLVMLKGEGELEVNTKKVEEVKEEVKEEKTEEVKGETKEEDNKENTEKVEEKKEDNVEEKKEDVKEEKVEEKTEEVKDEKVEDKKEEVKEEKAAKEEVEGKEEVKEEPQKEEKTDKEDKK